MDVLRPTVRLYCSEPNSNSPVASGTQRRLYERQKHQSRPYQPQPGQYRGQINKHYIRIFETTAAM
jgi:hypothetical protein